ncbi:MAG: formyl transferase [Bdellovibrionota bacterium]|nr:MAG: formyl transferase [Bdellovibrionota bacterium]
MHAILTNAELDLLVNMGGGLMKAATFNRPKMGTINVHPGLVPYYRGANANFWAVYHNDFKKVGVTVHQVDSGVDSGPVILTATIPVYKDDSLLKITRRAYESGVNMLITALVQFQSSGNLPPAKACDDKFAAYGWYGLTHYLRFLSRLKSLND